MVYLVQNMLFYSKIKSFLSFYLHFAQNAGVYTKGRGKLPSCDLMWSLQHLHQEGVDRCVSNQLEEEQMLQTLEADGAQCRQPQQQFSKPAKEGNDDTKLSDYLFFLREYDTECGNRREQNHTEQKNIINQTLIKWNSGTGFMFSINGLIKQAKQLKCQKQSEKQKHFHHSGLCSTPARLVWIFLFRI